MDTPLLNKIISPADLKNLSIEQLYKLAGEIRGLLIETVAETGGHIGPNLGVVELTIALHSIFDCPVDKIIWDVGHQSYIHKILTGRREGIATLRQYSGISGFPKRAESHCDPFDTGHSSTSISAALGMAIARDLQGEKNNIIAVIGDGAMTGGMAFEALNHAGHIGSSLIVILNDNEMSISENVGALAGYLSRMRTDPKYYKHKEEMELLMKKIPSIGSWLFPGCFLKSLVLHTSDPLTDTTSLLSEQSWNVPGKATDLFWYMLSPKKARGINLPRKTRINSTASVPLM